MLLKKTSQWWNQRINWKIPQDKRKWKYNLTKSLRCSKSSSKRGVHSDTNLPQEIRKLSNKHLTYHLKELEKEEKTKPKFRRRKGIIKITEEINTIEIKRNNRKDQ